MKMAACRRDLLNYRIRQDHTRHDCTRQDGTQLIPSCKNPLKSRSRSETSNSSSNFRPCKMKTKQSPKSRARSTSTARMKNPQPPAATASTCSNADRPIATEQTGRSKQQAPNKCPSSPQQPKIAPNCSYSRNRRIQTNGEPNGSSAEAQQPHEDRRASAPMLLELVGADEEPPQQR